MKGDIKRAANMQHFVIADIIFRPDDPCYSQSISQQTNIRIKHI